MTLKEQIKQLQELRIQEIIDDTTISKTEKLKLFAEEKLFDISQYIIDNEIFVDWEEDMIKQMNNERLISDTFICNDDTPRYMTKYFYEIAAELEHEIEPMIVLTNRNGYPPLKKRPEEVIDKIYDYSIKNKAAGFVYDW